MSRLLYLRDPLFLMSAVAYMVNRFLIKPATSFELFHGHFNDFICVPIFVPIMLAGMKLLGLRSSDGPPKLLEVFIPLFIWTVAFEIVLPCYTRWGVGMTVDHRDVFYYVLGAFVGSLFWSCYYLPWKRLEELNSETNG